MTRTSRLTAILGAGVLTALAASGCGSSSTINPGTGGTNGGLGGKMDSGAVILGTGGGPGGIAGRGGQAGRAGTDAGVNRPDAGFNMCTNNTPCTAGFTCNAPCNVAGVAGTRACTCANTGLLNCPNGNATCIRPDAGPPPPMPDAGFNMCTANTPCTQGFACRTACNAGGGVAGTRACTCNAQNTLACPGGGGTCVPDDAGMPPVDAPVDSTPVDGFGPG
jgi:hypothetical protein